MQSKLVTAAIFSGAALISQVSAAADGKITFTGEITAQTCIINGGTKDFTVGLPKVSASSLAEAGQTAGLTRFTIALTKCTPDSGNAHAYFEPGLTTDATTGNLIVDTGGATNVQIGLLNSDATVIKAGFPDATQNSKGVAIASGAANLIYLAQYVATGKATAGKANSSVMYTIAYQ